MRLSEFHSAKDGWTVFPQAAMNELPDGTSEREIQALSLYRLVENAIGAAPIADPEVEGFWSLKSDHCGWVGVACGDRGVVQRIDLRAKGLTGALPAEWARLTGLKYVNLGNNQLTSGLPSEWSALSDLKQLFLNKNHLNGSLPDTWSQLRGLQRLQIQSNNLSGTLPPQYSSWELEMESIIICDNQFTGKLPDEWASMRELQTLQVYGNKMTGPLPPSWSKMRALAHLDAHENLLLSATLPEAWSAMSSLRRLNVAWSGIQGVLPESWAALQDLEVLNLRGNKIAGTLPASWTEMPELVHLSLDYNAFTGGLPYAWGFFPASVSLLGLSNNKRLSGTLPESWQHLYVSQIFLDNCSLTGEIPQSWLGMVQLEELSVQNNNLSGTIGVESADRWRNVELDIRQNTIHVTISEEDTPPGWKVFPQTLSNALVYSKPTTVATSWNDTQVDATVQEAFVSDAQTPPMTGDGHVPINKVPESQQAQLSKISTASIAASVGVSIIALASIVMCIKYTGPRRFFRGIWNGQVYPGCQVAGRPTASHMISRFLMRKLTVQGKSNVEFENLDVQVLNLHDGMSKDYKDLPMRLLAIDYVVRASYIASYEEVPSCHYLQMPYSETTQELWNQVAVVSWRWGMAKPDKMTTGFSPMSRVQLQELQRYLALSDNLQYVWIDWSCVPQYDIDPMFEVARSKLFYSRARVMVIIPEYLPLPEEHLMRVMISSAVRALARGVPGTAGETDEENQQMAYKGLKHVRESGIYASFGYFGRVWTLAERMARHGRRERLQNWLSLETWLGMTLNALWAASAEDAVLTNVPGLQFYWGRLFDPQKARATIENLRLVRTRGSNLASDTLNTELALLFTEAVQVWKNGSVTEALDVEWLRTYLQDEAGILYQSWRPEDAVWSIYTFFCWHMRSDFRDAHRDLCLLAGISEIESNLFEIVHPPAVVSNCFHAGIQTRRSTLGRVVPCSQTEAAAAIYGCRPEDVARALCRCHQCGCK